MISVVIPAYNEEQVLSNCLNALTQQDTKENFEVILVDNNSTDSTRLIAEEYKKKLNLHIISEKRKGRGIARKSGFQAATGDIILSTDADTVAPANWITGLTKQFSDQKVIAVTGTCSIIDASPLTNLLFTILYQPSTEIFYRLVHKHWCLIGPNFAIRRDAYMQSGGFNEKLNCREDADLSERVSKIGVIKRINLPVNFSGRRYKNGLLMGALPYVSNQIKELFIGRENIVLEDIR